MKLYRLCNAVDDDSVMIDSISHDDVSLISGARLPPEVLLPFEYEIDLDLPGTSWPTSFLPEPVFSVRFVETLRALGVSNIEDFPVVIRGAGAQGIADADYRLLNIVGRVACADLQRSDFDRIGEAVYEFDVLVIDGAKVRGQTFFRLHESPTTIVVAETLAGPLRAAAFPDIFFEEIPVS